MSIVKNLSYNLFSQIVTIVIPLLTIPYISRILGPENIGIIGFSISFPIYFSVFANLGIQIYGSREVAKLRDNKQKRDKLFSELFLLTILSSLLSSIGFLLTIFFIENENINKFFLLVAGIPLYISSLSIDWYYTGREKFKMIAFRSITVKLISVILIFSIIKNENDSLFYLIISVFSVAINNIWNFSYLIIKELSISFRKISLVTHIRPMFVLLSTALAVNVYTTLDTVVLGFFSSFSEVGYYHSAIRISRLLLPFAVVTTAVLVPKISYDFSKKNFDKFNEYLNKSFSLISFFAVPMCVGVYVTAESFVPFFFGPDFLPVIQILQILSLIMFLVGLSNFFGIQVLTSIGMESKLLIAIIIGALINLCLNVIFIPRFGAIAAASASVIAELIILIMTVIMTIKYTNVRVKWFEIIKSFICCLPMIFSFYLSRMIFTVDLHRFIFLALFGGFSYIVSQQIIFKNKLLSEFKNKLKILNNKTWI